MMQYTLRSILLLLTACSCSLAAVAAEVACTTNEGRLSPGDPCIPRPLLNYLYCLSKSGGGRIEVTKTSSNSADRKSDIKINIFGSDVVLTGRANGNYTNTEVERAANEIREKLDASLVSNCKFLSMAEKTSQKIAKRPKIASPRIDASSVDFILGEAVLTERSVEYLRSLGKNLSRDVAAHIVLIPELPASRVSANNYANDEALQQLIFRRQMTIRNELINAGISSDQIEFESGSLRGVGENIRLNNSGKRIESGMMIEIFSSAS